MHVGVTESVGAALSYRRLVGIKLQGEALKRTTLEADFVSVLASGNFAIKDRSKREISRAVGAGQKPNADRDPKAKGKGGKATRTANLFSHDDFLRNLTTIKLIITPRRLTLVRAKPTSNANAPAHPRNIRRQNQNQSNQNALYGPQANQNQYRHPRRPQQQQQQR